jgi:hypothetical protein
MRPQLEKGRPQTFASLLLSTARRLPPILPAMLGPAAPQARRPCAGCCAQSHNRNTRDQSKARESTRRSSALRGWTSLSIAGFAPAFAPASAAEQNS